MKIHKIRYGICAAFCFIGCADDNSSLVGEQLGIPITIQCEINQEYVTRANDGGFADGDQIGVFVVNRDNGATVPLKLSGNHANNVRFNYHADSKTWEGAYQIYWKDKHTHIDAYGYYPFDSELSSVTDYQLQIQRNQSEAQAYEQSDFLWAKVEDIAPGHPINLRHNHIMAGIQVTLVEGEGFEANEWGKLEKSVLVENTILGSSVNLGSGEISVIGSQVAAIIPQQRGEQWRAVAVPQTVDSDKSLLAITVDGVSYHFLRSESTTYMSGKLYRFTIKVDKRLPEGTYEFSLLSESITPWENDLESHNGTAKEYVVVHIEDGQYLGDIIQQMGLDPEKIINLKLTGVMSANDNWFTDWENFYGLTQEDFNQKTNLCYIRHELPNMESINLKDLRFKHAEAYWDTDGFTSRWIEEHLKDDNGYDDIIPYRAFYGIHSLCSVVYPDNLLAIYNEAFLGTNLRSSCILPEGLRLIGYNVYSVNDSENENYITNELKEKQCHMTGDLYIPSSVEFIGDYAFYRQEFTNELILPEKMSYLGTGAFGNCKYMTGYLHIPEGLENINAAWLGMIGLQGWAEVPQGVKSIDGFGCPISSLVIPEGVTRLGFIGYFEGGGTLLPDDYEGEYIWKTPEYEAWRKALREVYLPSTLKNLGISAFANSSIQHIRLPEGIETIPEFCFAMCEELQDTLNLPSTLYRIKEKAFRNCKKLEAVVMPANLGFIDDYAFYDCYSLNYIQCLGSEPPQLAPNAFEGVEKNNFTLVVPEGSVDAYRNAPGWCEFKRISVDYKFVCRPMQEKLLNHGHTYTMVLNSDGNWTVTHCPSWASVSKTSGYKKTELKVTVENLTHGAGNRSDSIVFTLNDRTNEEGKPVTCYYKLSQYDYKYEEDSNLTLQSAIKGNKKVNIFLCGDGYDAQDIAEEKYLNDMKQVVEYFFGIEPYKTYKDYFNVYTGFAMSRESGINSINQWRETKFETKLGGEIRLQGDWDYAMAYALNIAPNISPDVASPPLVIMSLNTDQYEGVTSMWDDGSAVAVCPMSTWQYPFDARGIVQHEAGGHGFGKLADEYIYHGTYIQNCPCGCCGHVPEFQEMKNKGWAQNLSLSGKYKDVEWRQLIFDTHYGDICDIYEGGYFHQHGVFRSEYNSCMNNNIPYYSTISRKVIVERIKQYAGETFDYNDFVSHDSREYGSKFITRATPPSWGSTGGHLSAPIFKKGSVLDLLKNKKK